jgi:iron complex transport system substrate-binding protein
VKIVSLLPSATEIVYALGLGDRLEGVTYECDYPEEARAKPVISDTALDRAQPLSPGRIDGAVREKMAAQQPIYVLDKERIQRIQPDLILAQDLCRVCAVPSGQVEDALDELGCSAQVLSLDPFSIEEIVDDIVEVGRATGTEARAEELAERLRGRILAVRRAAAGLPRVRTFCLEWSDPPFVAGHWIPGMVEIAGGENLLNGPREPSHVVSSEEIGRVDPEAVLFMPCGYSFDQAASEGAGLLETAELRETRAARSGRVFAVDATAYFSRPGPRIVDGLETLAWALHPETFPKPPPGRIAPVQGRNGNV